MGNRASIPISCIAVRKLSRAASLAAVTATLALAVPGGISAAQVVAPKPDLKTLVAQAKQLEFQINSLSEQYDGLRIQLTRAKANAKIAQQAASRGQAALAVGQQAIAQLAAANYMNSGLDPTFQALTTGDPGQFLSQASAIAEMDQSSGVMVSTLSHQVEQALRDKETAQQQIAAVNALETSDERQEEAHPREDRQGQQRGDEAGDGRSSSRPASTRRSPSRPRTRSGPRPCRRRSAGWATPTSGARPDPASFDCSGLVMWAYAAGGHLAAALHREPVQLRRARSPATTWSRATWSSSSPTSATSACTSATG